VAAGGKGAAIVDQSSFDAPSPIGGADIVESILNQRRSLVEIIDPGRFKSYDELKRKFDQILGAATAA
jgi:hypothetical protein